MIRALMVMELHGWEYETALVGHLNAQPSLVDALGFDNVPVQSTIWRARHERFSDELLRSIEECVASIRLLAGENSVSVPVRKTCSLKTDLQPLEGSDAAPTQREILQRADELTAEAQRRIFPAFSLNRSEQASIPEDAFWELQTTLG